MTVIRNGVVLPDELLDRARASFRPLTAAEKAALLIIFAAAAGQPAERRSA